MSMETDKKIDRLRSIFGGELAEDEVIFLSQVKDVAKLVSERKCDFDEAMKVLSDCIFKWIEIRAVDEDYTNFRQNIDLCEFCHSYPTRVSRSEEHRQRDLSEEETKFLQDMCGAIDFVTRNGIGFGLILNVLAHDIGEIMKNEEPGRLFSVGFSPKVSGWATYNREKVGDPDESSE
ncbi:MAG TPA: hypothetical protein PL033_16710 [Candidatus Brocadiia bacterium]|nr:hypothetical protein [Candidatus Brocadiia bacterium]